MNEDYCEQNSCYDHNSFDFDQNSPSLSQQYLCCANCGGPHYDYQCQPINETYYEPNPSYDSSGFDQPQPPQDFVDSQGILQALNKMQEELEEIKQDRRKKKEDMSIEEMRHEQQLVDYKIKDITNDLGYKRFRGEKIDEEYERDCEIRIRKLKQDFNEWGSEVRKKEQAYNEEQYAAARRCMLSIPFVDEDDYIPLGDIIARYSTSKAITPDLPIKETNKSLSMGDEHLSTIVENLFPILSEFEGISDDTSDVPNCDNNLVNVEIDFVESLIDRDTTIVHSSKIDPILEEFTGELAHIAPISPEIVEADFDPNDDTLSDDDSFENIEYTNASPSYSELVSLEKVNDVDQEEKEFDLEDIFQNQDIEPDQEGLISIDNSNEPLLELPEFESFHFDPSSPRPPPEPPDVEKCLEPEADNYDNEPSDDDNDNDDVEKDKEDEEEHLAPVDPPTVPTDDPSLTKDVEAETMTTVDQGMSVEEIERVIAERVANAIEAIAIYETKTNMARKSISQTEQQECKVAENANNKRKWESNHNGQCTVKFGNCKKVDHMTQDCRNPAAARNQRTHACYECGSLRHFKSECPIVKFQKRMDKKISTLAKRQTKNKRKFENTSRNSQNQQQQQIKRQKQWQIIQYWIGC
ncbi:reverse transcriptase domain-containing protein [Tanacetum coccineum]